MKRKVVIRASAREDIEAIDEYLAENASAEVAVDFVEALAKLFGLLASQPLMGRAWSPSLHRELGDVRIWPLQLHRGYLVFYKPLSTKQGVEILHVFDGARDIARLIDEDS